MCRRNCTSYCASRHICARASLGRKWSIWSKARSIFCVRAFRLKCNRNANDALGNGWREHGPGDACRCLCRHTEGEVEGGRRPQGLARMRGQTEKVRMTCCASSRIQSLDSGCHFFASATKVESILQRHAGLRRRYIRGDERDGGDRTDVATPHGTREWQHRQHPHEVRAAHEEDAIPTDAVACVPEELAVVWHPVITKAPRWKDQGHGMEARPKKSRKGRDTSLCQSSKSALREEAGPSPSEVVTRGTDFPAHNERSCTGLPD